MTATLDRALRRPFGRTGFSVAPLGFGGAPIGLLEAERRTAGDILNALLDRGVNLVDTAAMYRGSEALIGETVGHRRDEMILVSKCGHSEAQMPGASWSPELIAAQIDRSLERLRTDRLDVMLIHSCDLDTLRKGDALDAVVRARDAGKVRFVGYSGDGEAAIWAAAHPEIAVIQTSISICDQANLDDVLPACAAHGTGVMAKRPIANACWKGAAQYERYRNYAQPYVDRFAAMGLDPDAPPLAGAEWPEVALRFTAFMPGVHVAIVGTTRPERVDENLHAIAAGPLPADVTAALRAAFAAHRPPEGWPGLT